MCLPAYNNNNEPSIAIAVEDIRRRPRVKRFTVVDNNSKALTAAIARDCCVIIVQEQQHGYGYCVFRELVEGANDSDNELSLLCVGDLTFRAYDNRQAVVFRASADIVNGIRIVESALSTAHPGNELHLQQNFFTGMLLEARHVVREHWRISGHPISCVGCDSVPFPTDQSRVQCPFPGPCADKRVFRCGMPMHESGQQLARFYSGPSHYHRYYSQLETLVMADIKSYQKPAALREILWKDPLPLLFSVP